MELTQKIQNYLRALTLPDELTVQQLSEITHLVDLTSLNINDQKEDIAALCKKAKTPLGNVAAICVYPKFISTVLENIAETHIKIATVVNFPTGQEPLTDTIALIQSAIEQGANEIDLVFPYHLYQSTHKKAALDYVINCQTLCTTVTLKVILEVSAFKMPKEIYEVSTDIIELGVDFIKTSTGKTHQGATLESACAMLLAIHDTNSSVGFKASGGIRTYREAAQYLLLAKNILGENWPTPDHFRIGTSGLT